MFSYSFIEIYFYMLRDVYISVQQKRLFLYQEKRLLLGESTVAALFTSIQYM